LKGIGALRGLALMALALFLLTSTALADPADPPTDPPTDPPIPVNVDIATINSAAATLAVGGDPLVLQVLYRYPAASDEPLVWKNSNANVASIDPAEAEGLKPSATVTAVKDGRTTITLEGTRSLKVLAKCYVTVRTIKPKSFSISARQLTIAPNQTFTLTAAVRPVNATFREVTWATDNPAAVGFGPLGVAPSFSGLSAPIFTRGEGTARVTATLNNGRVLACTVTVRPLNISWVRFRKPKYTYFQYDPNPLPLTAVVSPSTAGVRPVYSSSDEETVVIDKDTGALTFKKTGTVTITATAGGRTGKCRLTVASRPIRSLAIQTPDGASVILDPTGTAQLKALANPAYADNREVTWTSDNESVATVDETGLVTGVAGGYANITATSQVNARVRATVRVHVRGDTTVMRTVKISAAGDAVLGGDPRSKRGGASNPYSDAEFRAAILTPGDDDFGADPTVFGRVAPFFAGENNIATFNMEGTLTTKRSYGSAKPFVFRGHPGYAASMLKANFVDAVCVANNHTYDVGTPGYNDTKKYLLSAGVRPYGNSTVSYVPSENGLKVAFLGFVSKGLSTGSMASKIRAAARKSDMVVVAFHWTDVPEFRYANPTGRQRSLARTAISAGADLVTGHHTHRLNGIECYKGKYIVYDLGNFVTIARNPKNVFLPNNPQGKYDYDSLIYQQNFNVWTDGFVEAADIRLVPCAITSAYASQVNNCQPAPYTSGEDIQRVIQTVRSHTPDFDKFPITY